MARAPLCASVLVGLTLGCGPSTSAAGAGSAVFSATGEEAAVEGYPTSTGIAFADGWSLAFAHVFVSLDQIHLRAGGVATPLEDGPVIVDLHDGDQELFRFPGVPARRYDDVGYRIAPPTAASLRVGSVSESDAASMVAGRHGIWLVGTATHPTHGEIALDLGVPMDVDHLRCVNETDMTDGIVVPLSGSADAVLTFHLDHFFFDSIIAEEPAVRFDAYAAAAGTDGIVTFDDLASQPLADLHGLDGGPLVDAEGQPILYDPGSTPDVSSLRGFVLHQATTIGHFNGDGHCDYDITPAL
jgi:hypothetical protein